MKDEIKEILDYLKIENGNIGSELSYEETHLLLDYITNLEQDNERLKEELRQEKKDFKEVNDYCFELRNYKSRNEKTIEILKEAGCYDEETKTFCDDVWEELPKLLNTLTGGDEE